MPRAAAFTEKARPPPLEYRHVVNYVQRTAAGGPAVRPDVLLAASVPASPKDAAVRGSGGQQAAEGCEPGAAADPAVAAAADAAAAVVGRGGDAVLDGPDGWELQFGGQDPARAITVSTNLLEFGTCSRLSASEYQPLVVTNRSTAKVTAFITAPLWQDAAGGEPRAVFQVRRAHG